MKMAYVTSNRTISNGMGLGARLTEIGKDIVAALRSYRVYRETLTELQALSTRELADLGLNASMLRSIALQAAYGKRG